MHACTHEMLCALTTYFMSWGLHCKTILNNQLVLSCTLHQPLKSYSLSMPLVLVDASKVHFQLAGVTLL